MLEKRYPKEIVLKDGKEVILRQLSAADAEALRTFYEELPLLDRWFFKEDTCRADVIQNWIDHQEQGNAFAVLATYAERIVAHAALLWRTFGGRRHVGHLRVMVAPDFRSNRLGTWMLFDLVRRAMDLGLEKIRADFIVGIEDAAIEAVRRLDFVQEGLLTDYVRDPEGRPHDYQIMVKDLHQEWSDF
jgi:L-amino acid N-acyltransferase YncA